MKLAESQCLIITCCVFELTRKAALVVDKTTRRREGKGREAKLEAERLIIMANQVNSINPTDMR